MDGGWRSLLTSGQQVPLRGTGDMEFEAQAQSRLILLTVAGAVFAGAGLWLLLKPKPSGTTAKIELFGLKFESSSAGLLVFLIGAVFFVLPLFIPVIPEKAVVPEPCLTMANGTCEDPSPAPPAPSPGASVAESEPNDQLLAANRISLGQSVSGEVREGNDDWFVVAVPAGHDFVELRLRNTGVGTIGAHFFDAKEESMGKDILFERDVMNINAEVAKNDRFYVWLWKHDAVGVTGTYEFSVVPAAE